MTSRGESILPRTASEQSHVQMLLIQSDDVFETFNTAQHLSKSGSGVIRKDRRLQLGRLASKLNFPVPPNKVPAPGRARQRLVFVAPILIFVGTVVYLSFKGSKAHSHEASASRRLRVHPSKILNTRIQRPPSVQPLLPRIQTNAQSSIVPKTHLAPFVYTVVGIAPRSIYANDSEVLLFLYTQGTIACTGERAAPCSHLHVTSCMVGSDMFPVVYEANGVFTCSISRALRHGEPLTVIISKDIWKEKRYTAEDSVLEEQLESLARFRDGSYVVPSSTIWEGQMDPPIGEDERRYRICIMTQEKVFPDYVPEWLTYHRRIGVDYVYIYDNNSPRSLSEMYKNADDVEIVNWPWERSQIQAQNHFLLVGRRRCQWGILIDVDEFVMMRPGYYEERTELPLKAMLRDMREIRDISQIRVRSVVLGSSGQSYRPRRPMAESYWHLASFQDNLTKPIVWLGHTMPDSSVHRVDTSPGYYTELSTSYLDEKGEIASIGLCHFKYKSWEDYVEKGRGGRNSFQVGVWDHSSNWSIHSPPMNHFSVKNKEMFTDFRRTWRRTMGLRILEPELCSWNEAAWRYERIKRNGWVWKRRRALVTTENATMSMALIERERAFHRLKDWEVVKKKRFAQWNKKVDFLT